MPTKSTIETIAVLAAAYPTFNFTEQTIGVYTRMLADLAPDDLMLAVHDCIATSKFFPTIAEIREKVVDHRVRRANLPLALEAWGEVTRAFGSPGAYGRPRWSTPLIEEAVRAIGGWTRLCLSEEGLTAMRARFVEIYDGLLKRAKADDGALPQVRKAIAPPGGLRSIAQLTEPRPAPNAKPPHINYRAALPDEIARGEAKTPEQLRAETIIRGVKEVDL